MRQIRTEMGVREYWMRVFEADDEVRVSQAAEGQGRPSLRQQSGGGTHSAHGQGDRSHFRHISVSRATHCARTLSIRVARQHPATLGLG